MAGQGDVRVGMPLADGAAGSDARRRIAPKSNSTFLPPKIAISDAQLQVATPMDSSGVIGAKTPWLWNGPH
jgi:hypothetical protein